MKRKESKKEAARIAEDLIERASRTAIRDPELAREQAALARRVALKFNLRFDWRLKRFYCHGCKGLLFPGLNAKVRLRADKTLVVTCEDCGHVNRKKLKSRLNIQREGLTNSLRV